MIFQNTATIISERAWETPRSGQRQVTTRAPFAATEKMTLYEG